LDQVQAGTDEQRDVMSIRTATRTATRALERRAARRHSARSRRELHAVLDGAHGAGVRADVLAAMDRRDRQLAIR
jgi:hypothetical protein